MSRALVRADGDGHWLAELPAERRATLEEELLRLWAALESAESKRAYQADWRRWCTWLAARHIAPAAATAATVQRYLIDMGGRRLSKATRARALAVLRKVYAAFVRAGVLQSNPAREAENIRVSSEPRTPWLSEDELRALLVRPATATSWRARRDWLVLAWIIGTGLRRRDVARIRWADLFAGGKGRTLCRVVVKGDKEGVVPVPLWVTPELAAWRKTEAVADAAPMFPRDPGALEPISPGTVRNIVKRAAVVSGLAPERATPHALRRSFVTLARQRGASIEDLQATLLHASKATTERYDRAARISKDAPGDLLGDLLDPQED